MGLFPPLRVTLADAVSEAVQSVGRVFRGDVRSADWDGGGDLSGGKDTTATRGYLIDYSSGSAQFQNIFAEGGIFGDILSSNWDGSDPVDLSSGPDAGATVGYALDASAGVLQTSQIFTSAGGSSAPSVSYSKDKRTGMYFYISGGASDGAIGFSIQGTAKGMTMDPTSGMVLGGMPLRLPGGSGNHMIYLNLPTAQTGTTAVLYSNGTDYDLVPQSSTIRDKEHVTRKDDLADIELIPSRWQRKARTALVGHIPPTGDNPWEYGLIAEDLIAQDPTLGIWDQNIGRYND